MNSSMPSQNLLHFISDLSVDGDRCNLIGGETAKYRQALAERLLRRSWSNELRTLYVRSSTEDRRRIMQDYGLNDVEIKLMIEGARILAGTQPAGDWEKRLIQHLIVPTPGTNSNGARLLHFLSDFLHDGQRGIPCGRELRDRFLADPAGTMETYGLSTEEVKLILNTLPRNGESKSYPQRPNGKHDEQKCREELTRRVVGCLPGLSSPEEITPQAPWPPLNHLLTDDLAPNFARTGSVRVTVTGTGFYPDPAVRFRNAASGAQTTAVLADVVTQPDLNQRASATVRFQLPGVYELWVQNDPSAGSAWQQAGLRITIA